MQTDTHFLVACEVDNGCDALTHVGIARYSHFSAAALSCEPWVSICCLSPRLIACVLADHNVSLQE